MAATTEITRLDLIAKSKLDELLNADILPKVTSDDNGLALIVVNGKWAKATILTLPDASKATDGSTLQVDKGKWVIVAPQEE